MIYEYACVIMHINKKLMLAAAANDPEYLRYAIIISNGSMSSAKGQTVFRSEKAEI